MKRPLFRRLHLPAARHGELGITMVLVAIAMVAIIAMAALSIDVVTLYVAREEAQRAADAGALAAARVISISGVTGTAGPDNDAGSWSTICGSDTSVASLTAKAAAQENSVGGSAATVTVTYSSGSGSGVADCTAVVADDQLGVNPLVTVQVRRDSMPTLFSRIWSRATSTVSATATAEAFNPSNSGSFAAGGAAVPVTPSCVKPWIIPNEDKVNGGQFIDQTTGAIKTVGIRLSGGGTGIVGESFLLTDNCTGSGCSSMTHNPPRAGYYVPALVTPPASAVPTCADDTDYQKAIGGCDVKTIYACGTVNGSRANLLINPGGASGDTSAAAQCLIHQSGGVGQDVLDVSSFPYQIKPGSGNLIITSASQVISTSNSIVTLPIYDDSGGPLTGSNPQVTILGFLQVFIDSVDGSGNLNVHVLNVAGCGNDASTTLSAPGTSPVPIRLITPQ
ncbi:MAG TPA: pilus assembly protein TadG-related protein [Candidatus Sulfotelmatobacter sp.]|nr:pilus assembly protein TadG-related protein [Candidatus Sulfotelmatobacter sp.]